jgi:hypothetical protein
LLPFGRYRDKERVVIWFVRHPDLVTRNLGLIKAAQRLMKHVVSNSSLRCMVDSSIDTTSFGRTKPYRSFAINKIGSINKITCMPY